MRPRFELAFEHPSEEVWSAIEQAIASPEARCTGWVQEGAGELHVLREDEHFFSPMLCLCADDSVGGTVLRGRFGPHPHVWMFFMAIYFVLGAIAVGGAMYGISQWMMGAEPWALWLTPAGIALAAFVYGAAFIGQGLGAEQMHWLWSVVDDARHKLDG